MCKKFLSILLLIVACFFAYLSKSSIDKFNYLSILELLKDDRKSKALNKKLDDADKRITVQSAKGKGRELQKWVCTRIAKLTNIPFDNKDDNCKIHSSEMGQSGVDIILRDEALQKFPFSIECKSTESINLRDFIQQIIQIITIHFVSKTPNSNSFRIDTHARRILTNSILS